MCERANHAYLLALVCEDVVQDVLDANEERAHAREHPDRKGGRALGTERGDQEI